MAQIICSPDATKDLEQIGEYISKASPRYAHITVEKLYHAVDILKLFPRSGRIVPELHMDSRRELIVGNYRILHRLMNGACEILRIFHVKRDLLKILV
ncbi:MAG: type II toxin-antitoxin system RelE/ParE family toxin [Ignavibacteriae bacterium]|nr:type II toxin-antitoxin system RelE/ParE family toxin [Ignavibacteriota bacterium]